MKEDRDRKQKYLEDNKLRLMSVSDQSFWEAKPAARLKRTNPDITTDIKVAEMAPIRDWMYDKDPLSTSSFLRNGVRYRNGRLVVPVDGTYFLYSLIDFFEPCDHSTGKPSIEDLKKPIKHALFKFNIDTAESEITSNIQPHHISKNKFYNSYSSYVSTIVSLKAGDEISVKVSNITYLQYTKDNSFGLYLI
ncbi:tumor necrosis factor ligand superfamily member 15-like isoform X6 [Ruditapes philippinarum]|nr:tumor necrosis factor ligand superfamily member 15-like isoform X6 [Ruditapes philippinarum]